MPDSVVLSLTALLAAGLIALALVWPQGQGALSPRPFGHPLAPIEAPAAGKLATLRGPAAAPTPFTAPPARAARP
jgi:hypothetical protein